MSRKVQLSLSYVATLGEGVHGKCGQIGGVGNDEVHEKVLMRIR